MDIQINKDLIEDNRGNIYLVIDKTDNTLVLVNAFVHASFKHRLMFDTAFKDQFKDYEGQYIGKPAMDDVRHDYVFALKELEGKLYSLNEVENAYSIQFIKMIEYYKHPGMS
ncbi:MULTISPECIES: hypothetical protein [unclassified Paenibacillus]|uniref:Uncharacterized protein n=1 Tax=Paenibacillus provencensis TaxID=441151 RepID=A0ABW3PT52_9BACL|nr:MULTISPECIES: hypothetical protein [unclassified Paenibacillus]MCM3126829.1 hypothetical protein [Paenibacillus sp. MER 78]SFS57711.1 hypothetical protein SAMN04488601_1011996 [Paenibacillus sp. 453mf]